MNKIQQIIAEVVNDYAPAIGAWSKAYNCPDCNEVRKRGNHRFDSDGSFKYHCYNCGLTTGWTPGHHVGEKLDKLLNSFRPCQKEIEMIKLLSTEMIESGEYENTESSKLFQYVKKRELPEDAKPIMQLVEEFSNTEMPKDFEKVLIEINERNHYLFDLELYWSPSKEYDLNKRFIIPYVMNGEIIGYTARHIDLKAKMRYLNQVSTSIFFNFDLLNDENVKTILVCEGPIDAALMGGISANNHTLSETQIQYLLKAKERGKHIVIVPDRDEDGKKTIEQALKHGFSVSFPEFGIKRLAGGMIRHIKDIDEACSLYGRLYCVHNVYKNIKTDRFDILSKNNTWF